jgi:hypothetical protein
MRRVGGLVLTVTGFLSCPCHLIITLPLLLSLFAGTVLESFLKQNSSLVYLGASIYFVVALAVGTMLLFGRAHAQQGGHAARSTCMPLEAETHGHESSVHLSDPRTHEPTNLPTRR